MFITILTVLSVNVYAGWRVEQGAIRELEDRGVRVEARPMLHWRVRALFPQEGPRSPLDRAFRIESHHQPLTDDALQAVSRLRHLEQIIVYSGRLTGPGLAPLADLPRLRVLLVPNLTDAAKGLPYVARLRALEELDLTSTDLTDTDLSRLPECKALRRLLISGTGDEGLAHLSRVAGLDQLLLSESRVTDAGLPHLARMPGLVYLVVDGPGITDAGLRHLEGVRSLKFLTLEGTRVTEAGVDRLRAALPNPRELYIKAGRADE